MSDAPLQAYISLRYDGMPPLWDGFVRLVRVKLGISAFGANLLEAHEPGRGKP